ncbi:MAG: EAL domain-containing protein [Candidatus Eremiobacteraeota bacterium]|nr:EAL domain-containing protein [Candidatus Eremiobacteraeota bacterium]MBC5826434.1 EAL domain-containing protein [Candidatus Eremiobacteraeota bacterium]
MMKNLRWPKNPVVTVGALFLLLLVAIAVHGFGLTAQMVRHTKSLLDARAEAGALAVALSQEQRSAGSSTAVGRQIATARSLTSEARLPKALKYLDDLSAQHSSWLRASPDAALASRIKARMDVDVRSSLADMDAATGTAIDATRASFLYETSMIFMLAVAIAVAAAIAYRRALGAGRHQLKDIAERNRSLENAQRLAGVGNWTNSLSTGQVTYSQEMRRIFGLSALDPAANMLRRFDHPDDAEEIKRVAGDAMRRLQPYSIDHRIVLRDGSVRHVHEQAEFAFDENGRAQHLVGTLVDITERKQAEQKLAFLAHHDALTGLPNRTLLADRLGQYISHAKRLSRIVAVLFLDLDRFKDINDSLGHTAGDELLKEVGTRLLQSVRAGDTVARSGGDEFVIVLADIAEQKHVAGIVQAVVNAFAAPFVIESRDLFVTPSIGISLYPCDDADADGLIRNADAAMYQAKDRGRNNFVFYTAEIHKTAVRRLSLESDLRRAVDEGQFELHYQPFIRLATKSIVGFEALVRWRHPKLGLVPPTDFIPLAEDSGLIVPIGEWVLRTACVQHKAWKRLGHPTQRMAVNISARQFQQRDLAHTIGQALVDTGLSPQALEVEITESLLMKDMTRSLAILRQLKDMGIGISIDDFGTGYSSLGYLKLFPITTLKIDKSFVRDLTTDRFDEAIASTVVTLAKSLALDVIAEGVETAAQAQKLAELGCDEVQGFFFSKPQAAPECEALFDKNFGYAPELSVPFVRTS